MSVYDPLTNHLRGVTSREVELGFTEIERYRLGTFGRGYGFAFPRPKRAGA
jgi:hypothetical protein